MLIAILSSVPSVYALLALGHLALVLKTRQWWLMVLVLGAALETAGNALRCYGHFHPATVDPYIAMQCIVVVTPAFFAAVHFAILGRVLILFGRSFALVNPRIIIPFFVSLDVLSLIIQGVGSGLAATSEIDNKSPKAGSHIVVSGLSIQLLGYGLFDCIASFFASKAFSAGGPTPPPGLWTRNFKFGVIMAFISALLVLLRSCFRVGEMAEGWIGHVAMTEWYYYVFDATPVSIAVLILLIWHPSRYLPTRIEAPATDIEDALEKVDQTDNHNEALELTETRVSSYERQTYRDASSSLSGCESPAPGYESGAATPHDKKSNCAPSFNDN